MAQYAPSAYGQAPALTEDRGIYGRFGGLFIYGGLFIILMIAGAIFSEYFLAFQNFSIIFRQIAVMLPLAFAVGITVKTKGVDMSFAAMFALTSGLILSTGSFGAGIIIALLACIIIGAINAVCIHFLKLPGFLVTIVMYLIVINISDQLVKSANAMYLNSSMILLYVIAFVAVIIAAAIALVSSIVKNHRNKFWTTLLVYAGSGILAVLYSLGYMVRVQAAVYSSSSNLPTIILFIALFLSITRFFKSKALGAAFAIIPCIVSTIYSNILALLNVNSYINQLVLQLFVLLMIFIVFYRGRAQLVGQSIDRMYKAKSWIATIPLLVFWLIVFIPAVILVATQGMPSMLFYMLIGIKGDAIILIVAVGISIAYGLMKPKGSTIV